jgi:glutamate dehydrogenase (NAD(P)+)
MAEIPHDHAKGRKLDRDAVIDFPCDIWIPAARPDVIHADNVSRLRTRLVAQGANRQCTPDAEQALAARGVLVIPDVIGNAGGAIYAATEYQGGTQAAAFAAIDEKIRTNTHLVLDDVQRTKSLPRAAAVRLAEQRVRAAMRTRRCDGAAV